MDTTDTNADILVMTVPFLSSPCESGNPEAQLDRTGAPGPEGSGSGVWRSP